MQEMWEMQVPSLGQEDPLKKGRATHSSILAGKIPWTEEPGGATVHEVTKSQTRQRDFHFSSFSQVGVSLFLQICMWCWHLIPRAGNGHGRQRCLEVLLSTQTRLLRPPAHRAPTPRPSPSPSNMCWEHSTGFPWGDIFKTNFCLTSSVTHRVNSFLQYTQSLFI